jgi:hypothetical protein
LLDPSEEKVKLLFEGIEKMKKHRTHALFLPFNSIYHYLNGLQVLKQVLPKGSALVMCAAVSDFLPKEIPHHKIHTTEELTL